MLNDARVAGKSASDANVDMREFIAAKQWKKIEIWQSRLMQIKGLLKDWKSCRKEKKMASKKCKIYIYIYMYIVRLEKKVSHHLSCAYLILWEHSLISRNFISGIILLWVLIRQNLSDFLKVLNRSKSLLKSPKIWPEFVLNS